jgi:hypothetical protein
MPTPRLIPRLTSVKRRAVEARLGEGCQLLRSTHVNVVLSELLGLSTTDAVRWAALAGATGNAYAADVIRRPSGTAGISRPTPGGEFVSDVRSPARILEICASEPGHSLDVILVSDPALPRLWTQHSPRTV